MTRTEAISMGARDIALTMEQIAETKDWATKSLLFKYVETLAMSIRDHANSMKNAADSMAGL